MEMITLEEEKIAIEYLQRVLTEWKSFCEGHSLLTHSIEVLLKSNENRKESLNNIFEAYEKYMGSKQ